MKFVWGNGGVCVRHQASVCWAVDTGITELNNNTVPGHDSHELERADSADSFYFTSSFTNYLHSVLVRLVIMSAGGENAWENDFELRFHWK